MKKNLLLAYRWLWLTAGVSLIALAACKKGELIPTDRYMKFNLDAFFTDTSLFSSVKLNDTTISEKAQVKAGTLFNIANTQQGIIHTDSARLRVTVVKKNTPNVSFDSVVYFTNINDFLLLQLNPAQKPVLINKRLENITAVQPGKDSIKIRFYFNTNDQIKLSNGRLADSIALQFYTTEKITDGNYKSPQKIILVKGIKINVLSSYISLYTGDPDIKYGFELVDARSTTTILQRYVWRKEDGFLRGVLDYYGDGKFRTMRVTKSTKEGEYTFDQFTGFNADYLFGLN